MPVFQANNGIPGVWIDVQGAEYQAAVARHARFGLAALGPGGHEKFGLWDLQQINWPDENISTTPVKAEVSIIICPVDVNM